MKTSILALAMTTILFSGIAHSKVQGPVVKKITNNTSFNDVYSGVKFHYLDKADRLLVLNDYLKSIELEYALLPLKKKLIGLDFEKLKADAIAAENTADDVLLLSADRTNQDARDRIAFLQAKSNLDFIDRIVAMTAQFKDTHFSIGTKIVRPFVYNGLRFYRIENKVVLGAIETKFLTMAMKVSGVDYSRLAIGDQVIAVDGVNVEDRVKELKTFISGSTEEFVDSQAVRSLTIRNFKYPEKNFMTVTFKQAGTFKFPIFANTAAKDALPRVDAITYFNKLGIPTDATTMSMSFDSASKQWKDSGLTYDGYSPAKLHLNLKGLVEYLDDSKQPGMRTGYYIKNGKTYGVLQLLTFMTDNFTNGTKVQSFSDTIRGFVSELKDSGVPLILDLRRNGGGHGNLPAELLSILLEADTVHPGSTSGFRMTSYMRQIQEAGLHQEMAADDLSFGLTNDELRDIIQKTIDDKKDYTPMFASEIIATDQKTGGFDKKIVALVTPECVSACDKMSFLLKSSKRATIIGTTSNGTGAGFLSDGELNTKYTDPLRILDTQIPNYLFGVPGDNFMTTVFEEGSENRLCSENHPTVADVRYSPTMRDVAKNNIGWLEKAAEVLEGN